MGFLDTVRNALALPAIAAGALPPASALGSRANLLTLTPPEFFAAEERTVSRAAALSVPALARARRIIVSAVARCSLYVTQDGEPLEYQPDWVSRTDGPVSPYHRLAWTVDDLLFYGWSLWAVERDADGEVVAADRVPFDRWGFDADGAIQWDGAPVAADSVILIPGIDDGILAAPTPIRHALDLAESANRATRSPIAHTELHQTGGEPLTQEEATALRNDWIAARRDPNGAVSVTSETIQVIEHGSADSQLLIEGRSAAARDIANVAGIPAVLLDVPSVDQTIRYSNVDARNVELVDYCLASFMGPIAARLGLDDVVAPGLAVEFDTSELTAASDSTIDPQDD